MIDMIDSGPVRNESRTTGQEQLRYLGRLDDHACMVESMG